jgi:signal transduction histidine kinase
MMQTAERFEYLASFPEQNPNPIVEVDLQGQVRYANPTALRAIPGLREGGSAHPWLAGWAEIARQLGEGSAESLVRDVTVGDRVYQQVLHPLGRDGLVRIYGIDVTARARAEQALEELNRELERRVDERTAALHESQERYRVKCEQLEVLSERLAVAQDEERRRIAQGLHDEVCQLLVACHLKLGALRRIPSPEGRTALVEEIDSLLVEAGEELRQLAFELTSSTLYQVGFEAAVEELCDHMEQTFGVRVGIEWDRQQRPLAEDRRAPVYNAVRELLFNVVKHAGVNEAKLRVGGERDRIRIEVQDEGQGFDTSTTGRSIGRSGGFGLINIRERLRAVGATFEIQSVPGGGTRAIIEAPTEETMP